MKIHKKYTKKLNNRKNSKKPQKSVVGASGGAE
jgi:hypothetical protein